MMVKQAEAGMVVSLKGIQSLESGQGIGFEEGVNEPVLAAYMNYELVLPSGANALVLADACKQLASIDPTLAISVDEKTKRIHVQIMGEMQMEVLQKKLKNCLESRLAFQQAESFIRKQLKKQWKVLVTLNHCVTMQKCMFY